MIIRRLCAVLVGLVGLAGCGNPQYPDTPENGVYFSKGLGGTTLRVVNKADTLATIKGLEANKSTGELKLSEATFDSRQSVNQEVLVKWMDKFIGQQVAYNELQKTYGANAIGIISATGQAVAPLLGPFLAGQNEVALAEANRPSLLTQIASLLTLGKQGLVPDNPVAIWNKLPANIQAEVAAKYHDAVPTTQPVSEVAGG